MALVEDRLRRTMWHRPDVAGKLAESVEHVLAGEMTPYRAASAILGLLAGDN